MAYLFSGSVPSEISNVCELVSRLIDELRPRLQADCLGALRLILSELMINSCEHGNANDRKKGVFLDLAITDDYIDIIVTDEGAGFSYDAGAYDPASLSCSGRGLKIVSGLCDALEVQNTRVHCRVRRPGATHAE